VDVTVVECRERDASAGELDDCEAGRGLFCEALSGGTVFNRSRDPTRIVVDGYRAENCETSVRRHNERP
jgi:hypothetical protein